MMNRQAYSTNNEDFKWDDPEECLCDQFDNLDEHDHPTHWFVYFGLVTDVELLEPPGNVEVKPKGKMRYQLISKPGNTDHPKWALTGMYRNAKKKE